MVADFKVGDTVFVAFNERPTSRNTEAEVTKVGRKWVEIQNGRYRFNRDTLYIDGKDYGPPGRVWRTKEEYEDHAETSRMWSSLKRFVYDNHQIPQGVTKEKILQASALLGMIDARECAYKIREGNE